MHALSTGITPSAPDTGEKRSSENAPTSEPNQGSPPAESQVFIAARRRLQTTQALARLEQSEKPRPRPSHHEED